MLLHDTQDFHAEILPEDNWDDSWNYTRRGTAPTPTPEKAAEGRETLTTIES